MSENLVHKSLVEFVRDHFRSNAPIPLHVPVFSGREGDYVKDTIDSTVVSSVGSYVDRLELAVARYVRSPRAVATVNGTAALHIALLLAGVKPRDLVITQPLTFVATCNAIRYCAADPLFIDVDRNTMGLSAQHMSDWLEEHAEIDVKGNCRVRHDGRIIRAALPMHTFGHPVDIEGVHAVCSQWNIAMVEDAAESLGSFYKGRHTGTFGRVGAVSFNGNKIITCGGGGMVLADDALGIRAKHMTTTAKLPHAWEYVHDEVGYNYRLPNLNAALGCGQFEQLELFVNSKRALAQKYADFFHGGPFDFFVEPQHCRSNYWLNAVVCSDADARNELLRATNDQGVMTRPIWTLMSDLAIYRDCLKGPLENSAWLAARVVNLPSSVRKGDLA